MLTNRSVPTNVVLSHITYQNLPAAMKWLKDVFEFQEHYRYGPPDNPQGAQMHLGEAWFMVRTSRPGEASPRQSGFTSQSLTIFIENVEEHFGRSKSLGAKILEEPHETMYGEFQYAAEDIEGHHWLFSRHARDIAPEEWGAAVAQE